MYKKVEQVFCSFRHRSMIKYMYIQYTYILYRLNIKRQVKKLSTIQFRALLNVIFLREKMIHQQYAERHYA